MQKFCLALDLKDDAQLIEEYKTHHQNVWPEIIQSIKDAGITLLDIYNTGNRLFMIIEAEDDFSFEKKNAMDAGNPKVQQWEELMWKFQQALPWSKPGEKWKLMEKFFIYRQPLTGNRQLIFMTIDAHIHLWQYHPVKDAWITDDMKIIQRDFMPGDLKHILHENKTDGCIAVQAGQCEGETNFLLQCAMDNDCIKGVVGWIDLKAGNLEERLHHFSQYKKLKGFRHIVQAEPDGFLLNEKFIDGIKLLHKYNFTYDVLIVSRQLKEAAEFVQRLPAQKLIIDHCAKPDIKNGEIKEWSQLMKEIALHENVYCKLSGLFTEADWKYWKADDLYPYLDVVFEAFGTKRLLFGSDWPVILLAGQYPQWKGLLEKYMQAFTAQERENVFGANAVAFYNL